MNTGANYFRSAFLTLLCLISIIAGCDSITATISSEAQPKASRGVLDLREWEFSRSGPVALNGEWRFYWDRLLTPAEVERVSHLEKPHWIPVPGAWNDFDFSGSALPGNGIATYTLLLKLPTDKQVMGLRILDLHTAYRLYLDNELIASVGVVADNPIDFTPGFESRLVFFVPAQPQVRLTLQVANFAVPQGGFFHQAHLGTAEAITTQSRIKGFFDIFLAGVLLIMSCYHFGLFNLRRNDRSTLLFGIFCLIVSVRTILTGERIGFNLLFDWSTAYRIDILTIYWSLALFFMFFKEIFPRFLSTRVVRFTQGFCLLNTAIVFATPANLHIRLLFANHIILILLGFYLIYVLIREIRSGSEGAIWAGLGFLMMFVTIVNDLLMSNELIHTTYLMSFGVFFFILAQSYLLSIRFSNAFTAAERYSAHLKQEMANRMKVEKRLTESERKFRDLADYLPIAVAEYDFDLNVLYANNQAQQLFGFSESEIGRRVNASTLIPPEHLSQVVERLGTLRKGEIPKSLELSLLHKNGSRIWGEAYPSLIYRGAECIGVRTCLVDITERKAAEEQLKKSHDELELRVEKRTAEIREAKEAAEQMSQLKTEFLANVSHELRNPMHQILSYSKYGIDKIDRPREKLLHYFNQTRKAAERLMVLLNDLLDLSKMESGRMDYNLELCDMADIINEALSEFQQAAAEKNLHLGLSKTDDSFLLRCDYFKMDQVLRNLLANAVEYSPENTRITVFLKKTQYQINAKEEPCVQVSIQDQGVGIPHDELDTVFDKFTQSTLTKTGAGGTGLGLAISREIVDAHRGKIWAENNITGGVTICFVLPLAGTSLTEV